MGHFATGVTVITTGGRAGGVWGMTANSVTSLSLDPPLVLFAIDQDNQMLQQLTATPAFAINILRADQEALSHRFAAPGPKDFSGIGITYGSSGAPIFRDCLGFLECEVYQRLPGGDHRIVVGKVIGGALNGGKPLLFFAGAYNAIAHPPPPADHAPKKATTTSAPSDGGSTRTPTMTAFTEPRFDRTSRHPAK